MTDRPILVTGGSGQVARALAAIGDARLRVVGRPAFDFERPESLDEIFAAHAPALLVNAAAWTAVDAAEAEPAAAYRANRDGPARLARLCAQAGTKFVHLSTDYVFDGEKTAPYTEDDAPNPTGVYGASKLAGEQAVLDACPDAVILRTSWVYAREGKNFLRTMLGAASRGVALRVVADQIGCPTNADDLAAAIMGVVAVLEARGAAAPSGIFHAAGSGSTSWHGFAEAIFAAAGLAVAVAPIRTMDWPTPARRPANSRLDCSRLHASFGVALPEWRPSLARCMAGIAG